MLRFFTWIWIYLIVLVFSARAVTYALEDGQTVSGDPISFNESGVILKTVEGTIQPRTPYTKFTQDALKQLHAEALKKSRSDSKFIEPFITEFVEQRTRQREIKVTVPPRVDLPQGKVGFGALLGSPLGLFICALLYAANLIAAREIALFKNKPVGVVVATAAVLPLAGPALFIFLPGFPEPEEGAPAAPVLPSSDPIPGGAEAASGPFAPPPEDVPGAKSSPFKKLTQAFVGGAGGSGGSMAREPVDIKIPEPQIFNRAQFTFNRRFFETKMPGFFRVVPAENEKDLVILVKSTRGEFIGRRIPRITQSELFLQVFKGDATADEMIPFTEIQEVQIKHKDWD